MNRLRGSLDRERAGAVAKLLAAHDIAAGQAFWSGYHDTARKLGLMIRTNGLPLAFAIAMGWAKIKDDGFADPDAADDTTGRSRALVDLATLLWDKVPGTPAELRGKVVSLAELGRQDYGAVIDKTLGTLLWQKALSAPLVPEEKEKTAMEPDA